MILPIFRERERSMFSRVSHLPLSKYQMAMANFLATAAATRLRDPFLAIKLLPHRARGLVVLRMDWADSMSSERKSLRPCPPPTPPDHCSLPLSSKQGCNPRQLTKLLGGLNRA